MSQKKLMFKGILWVIDNNSWAATEWEAPFNKCTLVIRKVDEKAWEGVSCFSDDEFNSYQTYRTRREAMEGAMVVTLFMKKHNTWDISVELDIPQKEVESHLRNWMEQHTVNKTKE